MPDQNKADDSDTDDEEAEERGLDQMLATGLQTFVNTMRTKVVDSAYTSLVAFLLSLKDEQME